jgi:hypothetical protein
MGQSAPDLKFENNPSIDPIRASGRPTGLPFPTVVRLLPRASLPEYMGSPEVPEHDEPSKADDPFAPAHPG